MQNEQVLNTKERNASRQKSLLRGFVYFGGTNSAVECLVRDISDTGARLRFSSPASLINELELTIPLKGRKFKAKVIWRDEYEIGVSFIDVLSKPASGEDELTDRVAKLEAEITALKQLLKKLLKKDSDRTTEAA